MLPNCKNVTTQRSQGSTLFKEPMIIYAPFELYKECTWYACLRPFCCNFHAGSALHFMIRRQHKCIRRTQPHMRQRTQNHTNHTAPIRTLGNLCCHQIQAMFGLQVLLLQ
jgi:hypothetical protein